MCHNINAIDEAGNWRPPHKIYFPRKKLGTLSLVSAMLEIEYAAQSFYRRGSEGEIFSIAWACFDDCELPIGYTHEERSLSENENGRKVNKDVPG